VALCSRPGEVTRVIEAKRCVSAARLDVVPSEIVGEYRSVGKRGEMDSKRLVVTRDSKRLRLVEGNTKAFRDHTKEREKHR
jgi:hypothetical protein